MMGPAAGRLSDGRLHFQHGPIDLILVAWGPEPECRAAYGQAWAAFRPVLDDLAAVLPLLRTPVAWESGPPTLEDHPPGVDGPPTPVAETPERGPTVRRRAVGPFSLCGLIRNHGTDPAPAGWGSTPPFSHGPSHGPVADRMIRAAAAHAPAFVTPMAAVAGAVADHVLAAMVAGRRLGRAYVNDGGDAALWLASGAEITAAGGPDLSARIAVRHDSPVRGIATSGWRGRSHSLGIADAVTALARTAAEADVAATLIANAVDLADHPAIRRRPARDLAPDSDLGARPVTVAVGPLTEAEVARALAAGRAVAGAMRRRGLIEGAALWLGGQVETVGTTLPAPAPALASCDL